MSSSVTDKLPAEQHNRSRNRHHPRSLPTLEVTHARSS